MFDHCVGWYLVPAVLDRVFRPVKSSLLCFVDSGLFYGQTFISTVQGFERLALLTNIAVLWDFFPVPFHMTCVNTPSNEHHNCEGESSWSLLGEASACNEQFNSNTSSKWHKMTLIYKRQGPNRKPTGCIHHLNMNLVFIHIILCWQPLILDVLIIICL